MKLVEVMESLQQAHKNKRFPQKVPLEPSPWTRGNQQDVRETEM